MRLVAKMVWVFAVLVCFIIGCNEVTPPSTAPLEVHLATHEPQQPSAQVPVEGARLCELKDPTNCELTDANGEATLWLPIGETAYTRDAEGFAPWLSPALLPEEGDLHTWVVPSDQRIADHHNRVGSPYPMRGTGSIAIQATPQRAGTTFELIAATGAPWYMDEEWDWRPDLTETTLRGIGGFTEVTPGVVRAKLGGTTDRCVPAAAWPGNEPASFRAPIKEGYVTGAFLNCSLP